MMLMSHQGNPLRERSSESPWEPIMGKRWILQTLLTLHPSRKGSARHKTLGSEHGMLNTQARASMNLKPLPLSPQQNLSHP